MLIDCVDPVQDKSWRKFVEQNRSTVFHSPEWMRVLRDTYDFSPQAKVLVDEVGDLKAGIPFCTIEDMMDPRVASLPFSDFCDPLVETADEWNHLIDGFVANGHRMSMRCLHNDIPLHDKRFTLTGQAKWHCIDLEGDEEAIWQRLRGSARRAIRKARNSGIEVHIAQDKKDLRAFFDLHLRVRKYKYRLLAQPYQFFQNIWDQFIEQDKGALMLATHNGTVIGGVMFLEWQKTLYYKFNASNSDTITLRPNDLVVWQGIRYGQARGHRFFDFGLSSWDQEGLLRYKRKFATEEKTISLLRYTPEGSPSPKEKQIRQLLPQLTDLFVDESVPDAITEKAGDSLYRFFT